MLNDRKEAFEEFWNSYPPERRVKKSATRIAYDLAIWSIQKNRECEEVEAIRYMQERLIRFARSPVANGQFCWSSEKWLAEQHWEDADEAWGYRRREYVGTAIAKRVAEQMKPPAETTQNVLEALYGSDVDGLSDDEVRSIIRSPMTLRLFVTRGKTGVVRDVLLKEIASRMTE